MIIIFFYFYLCSGEEKKVVHGLMVCCHGYYGSARCCVCDRTCVRVNITRKNKAKRTMNRLEDESWQDNEVILTKGLQRR